MFSFILVGFRRSDFRSSDLLPEDYIMIVILFEVMAYNRKISFPSKTFRSKLFPF
jgi:hypothetical protein